MSPEQFAIYLKNLRIDINREIDDMAIIAGKQAIDFFKESFQKEGFTNGGFKKWPEVNRRGANGHKPASGARGSRKILTDSGNLGEAFDYEKTGPGEVTVSNTAETKNGFIYGTVHNTGVSDAGRGRNTVIPQRQFMGESDELNEIIEKEIERKLKDIFK